MKGMDPSPTYRSFTSKELKIAIAQESEAFERCVHWLETHMPPRFLNECDPTTRILIARNLLSFQVQGFFTQIHLKTSDIVLCLDAPDADLHILRHYRQQGIRYYRSFVSNAPPPGSSVALTPLRVAFLYFTETAPLVDEKLSSQNKAELRALAQERNPDLTNEEFERLLHGFTPRFVRSLPNGRLALALDLFFRAKTRDQCQYELRRYEEWQEKEAPSLQLILAWKNSPKGGFLFKLAQTIDDHGLALKKMVASYVDLDTTENILVLSVGLHGKQGRAAWEEADIDDFLTELCLLKYKDSEDLIAQTFVTTRLLTGNQAHLVRNLQEMTHQALLYVDPHFYSHEQVSEGLCRHPELTVALVELFAAKFDPQQADLSRFQTIKEELLQRIETLDTGQSLHDLRRKQILTLAVRLIECMLKTNFYRHNKSAFAFRLAPHYLEALPIDIKEKFPELPYAIFFLRGPHFLGFHIRFKDLARGGVRTVLPDKEELFLVERNAIFAEAYNLSYTQQKKNKDIPEGGAKTVILLEPFDLVIAQEEAVSREEMERAGIDPRICEEKLKAYRRNHRVSFLYAAQRSFIESFLTLLHCDEQGRLLAKDIVDYWKRPEYIYLGPDENMHNRMIEWIADYSLKQGYKPGSSFISSKPLVGINHKEFGVTSYGLNVYLHETLLYLGIDPLKDPFTIKLSGGPDGDVAGNEILNLFKFYPHTARLLALTDGSGTIYDPQGLDLREMAHLFFHNQAIHHYPPDKLSEGGFLLDLKKKKEESAYAQETLCWRKRQGQLIQEWLSGNEMNHLYRNHLHQVHTDLFVPAGGRPRTLNESNYQSFCDAAGNPSSKAIVEGANLYLTPGARRALEKLGVLVLKDSSCNKGGVICSSFEVLAGLCLSDQEFLKEKETYVKEVLDIIRQTALHEASLLLRTHREKGLFLTDISDQISEKINLYKYQLLEHLESMDFPSHPQDPLIRCLYLHCPLLLRTRYPERILALPPVHKKAMVAAFLAARLVYRRGIEWTPSIGEILPAIAQEFSQEG